MDKNYIAVWSVDKELKRGNKNSFHNFVDTNGDKLAVASKLHRVSGETAKKIWELIKADESKSVVLDEDTEKER